MASTTVTVTSTTTKVSPSIRFDPSYVRTIPGLLKIAQIVISLIGFICIQTIYYAVYRSAGGWYTFVSMTAFWVSLILLLFYLLHLIEKLHWIPWLLAEMCYCVIWAVFFFIAGVVAASKGAYDPAWGAGAFFAFVAMILYGYDGYEKFKAWRGGGIAQGERSTTTNTASSTTPATPSYPAY